MNRLGVTALAVFAALTMGVPPAQAFTTAAEDPPAQPTGKIKVYPVLSGTYTVTGPHKFTKTASVSKTFEVAPGTYRVTAPNAVITHGTLRVRAGQKQASTVTFGTRLRARAVSSSCALLPDSTVACWPPGKYPRPRVVPGIDQVTAVTSGASHTCALRSDGSIWCWGQNLAGQLGNGSETASPLPVRAVGISDATQVSAGGNTTCARTVDGAVWCWGSNHLSAVGVDSATYSVSTPVPVVGIKTAVSVATGGAHSCAVLADGALRCWGANDQGQLGNGLKSAPYSGVATPVEVKSVSNATSVTMGQSFTCALLSSGSIRCWGQGDGGQLGNGRFRSSTTPVRVVGITDAVSISGRCAVTRQRRALCWGPNYTVLGFEGPPDNTAKPMEVPGTRGARAISGPCVMGRGGTVSCWERAWHPWTAGLLKSSQPAIVPETPKARSVDVGDDFACALNRTSRVVCWGSNGYGTIGTSFDQPWTLPTTISQLGKVTSLATGEASACAVLPDGTVRCWGCLEASALQDCESPPREEPALVKGITNAKQIVAGNSHRCVLLRSGRVDCWGRGGFGQLGNGRLRDSKDPVRVPGLRHVESLSADDEHTCALKEDGSVACWGCFGPSCPASDPYYGGQLISRPKTVRGLSNATQVASAYEGSCALTSSRVVRCWGYPANKDYERYSAVWTAIPVAGVRNVRRLFAGGTYNYAVLADGRVKRWQGNGLGRDTDLTTMPSLAGARFIAAGYYHGCLVAASERLQCWGSNDHWQLGRRSNTDGSSPVLITWPNG